MMSHDINCDMYFPRFPSILTFTGFGPFNLYLDIVIIE